MRSDIVKAKELISSGYACAVCREGEYHAVNGRGIAPLLTQIKERGSLKGYSVADKIVGSAAAFRLIEAEAAEVFADTISVRAIKLLTDAGIVVSYENVTDHIINRSGDDLCPMEKTALAMTESAGAYGIFSRKLAEISE